MSGKIYLITCDHCNEKYVGSTTQELNIRLSKHKSRAKQDTKDTGDIHSHMKKVGPSHFKIELLANVNGNRKELHEMEEKWIQKLKPKLNENNPA
jgi:group I intron endonuclease